MNSNTPDNGKPITPLMAIRDLGMLGGILWIGLQEWTAEKQRNARIETLAAEIRKDQQRVIDGVLEALEESQQLLEEISEQQIEAIDALKDDKK